MNVVLWLRFWVQKSLWPAQCKFKGAIPVVDLGPQTEEALGYEVPYRMIAFFGNCRICFEAFLVDCRIRFETRSEKHTRPKLFQRLDFPLSGWAETVLKKVNHRKLFWFYSTEIFAQRSIGVWARNVRKHKICDMRSHSGIGWYHLGNFRYSERSWRPSTTA